MHVGVKRSGLLLEFSFLLHSFMCACTHSCVALLLLSRLRLVCCVFSMPQVSSCKLKRFCDTACLVFFFCPPNLLHGLTLRGSICSFQFSFPSRRVIRRALVCCLFVCSSQLGLASYAVGQTTLEQIFNSFAATKDNPEVRLRQANERQDAL